jgi:hypothetical protein
VIDEIARLLEHDTAGDPISGLKWTRKTTEKVATQLKRLNIEVSPKTVGRLLKDMGYSLRVNHKKVESGNKNPPAPQVRDSQFDYISQMRDQFACRGCPIISADAKKKERIGNFKNNGVSWEKDPYAVNDHDFLNDAVGKAVPYSLYDTVANLGFVVVGTSHETPEFGVRTFASWWRDCGRKMYSRAKKLLILVDSGGANGWRLRGWKYHLQYDLCDRFGLAATVCHYPPGASKWNPADHRLHSEISKNWAGKPLDSFETVLKFIRTTKTKTGLHVKARLDRKQYQKGERIMDWEMADLLLTRHKINPDWNYTITPHQPSKM